MVEHAAWHQWCTDRNKTLVVVIGLGVKLARDKLKITILETITDKKVMKNPMKFKQQWGIKKLQNELYNHCKKYALRRFKK